MTLVLHTSDLVLRPFEERDLETFVAYRSDSDTARYQSWDVPYTLRQGHAFLEEMQRTTPAAPGEWYQLAVELKSTGKLIGDCAFCVLVDDPRQAEIGFTLSPAYRGKGHATAAVRRLLAYLFGDLGLHRVRANCDVENPASARVLERAGMRREAHFVESVWFKGRWSSEYWYAMLAREWQERRAALIN